MTSAILFGFAVAPGHRPVPGTAPLPVLARQLPRSMVVALNGGSDRGIRFFPFLGRDGDQRRHLNLEDVLPVEALQQFAQSAAGGGAPADLLVDGILEQEQIKLRIHRTVDGRCRSECTIPFDPSDPGPALAQALFEITDALAWGGSLPPSEPLSGPALAWFLVARDDLLSWEAGVAVDGPPAHRLRAIHEAARLAPESPQIHQLAGSLAAHAARVDSLVAEAAALLAPLVEHAAPDATGAEMVSVAAVLHDRAGNRRAAASLHATSAELHPGPGERSESLRQAVALWFLAEDFQSAANALDCALGRDSEAWSPGTADARLLSQRLAVADRRGETELVQTICRALQQRASAGEELSPEVLRLVTAQLAAGGEAEAASELSRNGLTRLGEDSGGPSRADQGGRSHQALQLEHGRALLLAGRTEEGLAQLDALLAEAGPESGSGFGVQREAARLARLAAAEGLLEGAHQVEQALHQDRIGDAHKVARRLTKKHPDQGEAWFLLGIVEQRRERQGKAIKALRRALQEDQDLPEAANRLGILLVVQGKVAEGLPLLEQAVAGLPSEPAPRLHLAQACAASGDRATGERHLAAAESLGADPDHVATVRNAFFAA